VTRVRLVRAAVLAALLVGAALILTPQAHRADATVAARTSGFCGEQRLFGYIRSLDRRGNAYALRFDPAYFLSGATANQAAAQDGAIPKGQPVPNDNYVVNESRRTYLYTVSPATPVRVLLKTGDIVNGTAVGVSRLAELVHGRQTATLFEPLASGIWLGVHIDRACSIKQQYHP